MKTADAIALYIELRGKKQVVMSKAKAEVETFDKGMAAIENFLMKKADTDGVSSFKAPTGTAFKETVSFASVKDWDAVFKYAVAEDCIPLLTKGVSKKAVEEILEETGELPPGVNYGRRVSMKIRAPSNH